MAPLHAYLEPRNELLMMSGFTDHRSVRGSTTKFADHWELSAQRAPTVTRTLIDAGMPSALVFAAAFGAEQPVTPNVDEKSRSENRRVEMAPAPKGARVSTAARREPAKSGGLSLHGGTGTATGRPSQAPKNAGPINSHMLVLRSLELMRDISPDYLGRFMSYADTLLCLDQTELSTKASRVKPLASVKPRARPPARP